MKRNGSPQPDAPSFGRQFCPKPGDLVSQVHGLADPFHASQLRRCDALLDTLSRFGSFNEPFFLADTFSLPFPDY